MGKEPEVIKDEKIVKVSDPENWHGEEEVFVKMLIAIESHDEIWQSATIVVRSIDAPYNNYLEFKRVDNNYKTLKEVYSLLKERIFDKIPEPVSKEWFLDHGFINLLTFQ